MLAVEADASMRVNLEMPILSKPFMSHHTINFLHTMGLQIAENLVSQITTSDNQN